MIVKSIAGALSPSGQRARLSIFIFHRVLSQMDPLFPGEQDARRFNEILSWVARWFQVIPLDEAVLRLGSGTLPARAAAITFDDGYADNHEVALPILQRHGLRATFFIATSFLDGGRMWNDTIIETIRGSTTPLLDFSSLGLGQYPVSTMVEKRATIAALIDQVKYRQAADRISITEQIARLAQAQLPHNLMMTAQEVKAMRRAGMQIGAHTVSHPILAQLTDEQARQEIGDSKIFLERLLGERVGLFAYPNGRPGKDYSSQTVSVVRSLGFDAAVSTQWGTSGTGDDLFQIRRFTPWDKTRLRFGARMLANLRSPR